MDVKCHVCSIADIICRLVKDIFVKHSYRDNLANFIFSLNTWFLLTVLHFIRAGKKKNRSGKTYISCLRMAIPYIQILIISMTLLYK